MRADGSHLAGNVMCVDRQPAHDSKYLFRGNVNLEPNSAGRRSLRVCISYYIGWSACSVAPLRVTISTRAYPRRGWDHETRVTTTKGTEMHGVDVACV